MVKKVKKFNYQKDLKKKWKKMKDKKNPKINTHKLEPFWDPNKSIQANYRDLGLSINPNQTLGIPKTKNLLNPEVMEIEKAKLMSAFQKEKPMTKAVKMLLDEANQPAEKHYNLNENDALFCIYMIEKHGEDYKKMARDHQNHYQDTPTQIRKKINLFKKNKLQFEKYQQDKKNGVDFIKLFDN